MFSMISKLRWWKFDAHSGDGVRSTRASYFTSICSGFCCTPSRPTNPIDILRLVPITARAREQSSNELPVSVNYTRLKFDQGLFLRKYLGCVKKW